ncbi:MAG: tetratricopeptide repeat protein, partial [Halobaculum sp.]
ATGNSRPNEPTIEVEDDEKPTLRERIALRVNVLNAAEWAVRREFLLADGESAEEYEEIDGLIDAMQDLFWFEHDGPNYRTHHQYWSALYLDEHLNNADSEDVARRRFEECLNGMFELFDSEEKRDRLRQYFGGTTGLLDGVDEVPQPFADKLVGDVFEVGERRPKLVPLFGESQYSGIELPEVCSNRARVDAVFSRVEMYRGVGDSDRESTEIGWAAELSKELDLESEYITGNDYTRRGHHARRQGDFETAHKLYQQALDLARQNENRAGAATSLGNLGLVAQRQGEYEAAREYHEDSLDIKRDIGDRAGAAKSLGNLGLVARNQGEYEAAREYHQDSLDIKRDIGDRAGAAKSLNNLG